MSFQNQGSWMVKGENDAVLAYDNSARIEPKRSHQWFMEDPEVDPFPNKKQAVEVPNSNLVVGMLNSDVPSWVNASRFHSFSGHFTERLFDSEISGSLNFDDRNTSSVGFEKLDLEKRTSEDPLGNDFGLSMSHTLEDPRSGLNTGGLRKVRVCEVKDSANVLHMTMGHPYSVESYISTSHVYNKPDGNSIPMHIAYNKGEDNFLSFEETIHDRMDNNFMSMEQPYAKGEPSQQISQRYKENSDNLLMDQTFRHGNNSVISISQMYDKTSGNSLLTDHLFNKGDGGIISMGQTLNKDDTSNRTRSKDESTIISFGGYDGDDANTSERVISSFELLEGHPSVQKSGFLSESELVKSSADALLITAAQIPALRNENICKKEEPKTSKKGAANSFPSNVRSLLSTGMLDGVSVKYIAWAREKELHGVIKGSGYLCSCHSCSFSKVINAYEFERHAGCKTKHPNNHIYFENGKTIYGIVQELRSTPQNMLFEVLQTITGSPINQKSFRIWKDSFLAATRELQRIYGKDELKQLS